MGLQRAGHDFVTEQQCNGWKVYSLFIEGIKQFSSVAQSYPTLRDLMHCSTPVFPLHPQLTELTQAHVHQVCDPIYNHLILCRPLLLLPSDFPSIRVFSSELALCIRWPKYWSFIPMPETLRIGNIYCPLKFPGALSPKVAILEFFI